MNMFDDLDEAFGHWEATGNVTHGGYLVSMLIFYKCSVYARLLYHRSPTPAIE